MKSLYERQYVSRLVPKNGLFILTFIIATSVVDSVVSACAFEFSQLADDSSYLAMIAP